MDMKTNDAYGVQKNASAVENDFYELVDINPKSAKHCSTSPAKIETKVEKRDNCFKIFITVIAVTALLLVLIFLSFFLVHYISNQPLESQQNADIESLQSQLNSSNEQIQLHASELKEAQEIKQQLNNTVNLIEQIILPKHSCRDLPQGSPSGYYYIKTSNGFIQVYCDNDLRNCSCNVTTGWLRVVELDMTDPTQQCPDGFKLIDRTEPPLRTCGRPDGHSDGCVSTTFPVNGIEYSRVCGRIVGYQFGSPSGFNTLESSIDRDYMAGISLTHGLPRQHIWSFVNAQNENTTSQVCPCIRNSVISVPLFVGEDYFCDSAVRGRDRTEGIYHTNDPLWDGQGCGSTSTCCEFNNPPWFCKQLPQQTTDDIELRLCENSPSNNDDSPFESIQLYIN